MHNEQEQQNETIAIRNVNVKRDYSDTNSLLGHLSNPSYLKLQHFHQVYQIMEQTKSL